MESKVKLTVKQLTVIAPQRTLKSFNSLEELEENQLKYFAPLSPVDLLKNLKVLNFKSFGFNYENEFKKEKQIIKFE